MNTFQQERSVSDAEEGDGDRKPAAVSVPKSDDGGHSEAKLSCKLMKSG